MLLSGIKKIYIRNIIQKKHYSNGGYLDPAGGLKFADVPNGLAAISKVPAGHRLGSRFDSNSGLGFRV